MPPTYSNNSIADGGKELLAAFSIQKLREAAQIDKEGLNKNQL
nr:hypothetical protein [uncultured Emticicia sp.]